MTTLLVFLKLKYVLVSAPSQPVEHLILALTPLAFCLFLPLANNIYAKSKGGIVRASVVHISKVSYSIYLVHMIVLTEIQERMKVESLLEGVGCFAIFFGSTIVLSSLLYRYWEQPTLELRDYDFNLLTKRSLKKVGN